jgi:HlyD family secretion protein
VKKLLLLLILLALGLAGAAWWLRNRSEGPPPADAYTLMPVESGRIAEVVNATGFVQPREVYSVGTELAGKVVAVLADYNDTVEEGQVLARLDDRSARELLDQAESALSLARVGLRQAESERDRAREAAEFLRKQSPEVRNQLELDLAEGKLKSAQIAIDAARVRVRQAEQACDRARRGLRLTVVRAPVLSCGSGSPGKPGVGTLAEEGQGGPEKRSFVVLERKVSLNQMVGPPASGHLFTLASDLGEVRIRAQVVEADIHRICPGLPATCTISGADEDSPPFDASVEEVRLTPTGQRGAVFYSVMLGARNRHNPTSRAWSLRPGQTVSVDLILRVHEDAWKVPTAAFRVQPDEDLLGDRARAKMHGGPPGEHPEHWKTVWVPGPDNRPWPVFVRTGGKDARGEPGIQDGQFTEVLEWEPGWKASAALPQVIIGIPSAKKRGLFKLPKIKL